MCILLNKDDVRQINADVSDLCDIYQAIAAFRPKALLHMGSWPNGRVTTGAKTYLDNVAGLYNVFQASADLGVQRVIWGSSGQVYGFEKHVPCYLPVDEAHPCRPVSA